MTPYEAAKYRYLHDAHFHHLVDGCVVNSVYEAGEADPDVRAHATRVATDAILTWVAATETQHAAIPDPRP